MTRTTLAVALTFTASAAFARPPARQHASPELLTTTGELTPGARFLATLPASAQDTLRREGAVVLAQKQGSADQSMLHAVIRFERPVDAVFAVITQPSTQHSYLPHVTASKTVGGRSDEGEATDMVVSFLFTFRYRTQHWFYPEEHRMEWSLDPSGADGLREQQGYFQLYALDDGTTLAEYGTRVVARDGFLNFLRGLGERGGVEEALRAIRRHVHTTAPTSRLAVSNRQ